MFLKIVGVVIAILVVLCIIIATRPAEFKVERSASIAAPPGVIYAQVADFHQWASWSPWARLDPNMKTTYSGADGQPGAVYMWTGNDQVGEGRMTVVSAKPGQSFVIKLEFLKPFAATNESDFTFVPVGQSTQVTWSMMGQNNFMAKAFSMLMNMDKMVGGDFEKGLSQLKTVSEVEAKKAAAAAAAPPAAPAAAPAAPAVK